MGAGKPLISDRSRPASVRVRIVGDGPIPAGGGVMPGQIAEIIVALDGKPGRRGSGYRVGHTSVLTAARLIDGAVSVRGAVHAPCEGQPLGTSGLSTSRAVGQTKDRGDATLGVVDAPRNFTAAVHQEEDWYVAQCLEVDVASQGRSIPETLSSVAEAVELYLDEVEDPQQQVGATPLVTSFQVPGAA